MSFIGWLQIFATLALVVAAAIPLGSLIAGLIRGERNPLTPLLGPLERSFYRLAGVDPAREHNALHYTVGLLAFNAAGFLLLYAIQRLQHLLPLNPQGFDAVPADLAFNTGISFLTNADWQNYAGETTMSHFTQMAGLTVQNYLSAATGLATAFAFTRAFTRSEASGLGNFYVDMTRAVLYLLLPLAIIFALVLVVLGVPQTFAASVQATTLEGVTQTISLGPVASQEAIKFLGTNGGGFFNTNSAHPFENPSAVTNLLETFAQLVLPVATVFAFGACLREARQGRTLLYVMGIVLLVGAFTLYFAEASGNPILTALGVDPSVGNLEGKELRFGQAMTALFTTATTGTGTGAADAMHDSLLPIGGLVALFNLLIGCVTPGGVGSGLYGMLIVALLAIFIAGLMIGRTPEYLGKKIEAREMKLVMFASLIYPLLALGFAAASMTLQSALDSRTNMGPHGFTEILYAYASTTANNGSIFAGLNGNTPWYNTTLGIVMLIGRFFYIVPVLSIAKSIAGKKKVAASAGTFPTDGALFVALLLGVLIIVYLLQYFAVLALGPIVEHFLMLEGKTF
ncbi:K+-transporting ATPase ATPase A chain [Rhizobiales bacterium GAS191]|nr:K+-transporting ATPase ATPase A chain [Rhizobiales bacterium GAS113]SEE20094.1 K+-transporting ATPase ATPase A chain [Rhizobiales bacterium GAS191]